MSDDLVKRLRATCSCNIDNTPCLAEEECRVAQEAADRIEELKAELHLMKTSGIVEVAVRNPSVMEYMKHWEGRAEAAEAKLAACEKYRDAYAECDRLGTEAVRDLEAKLEKVVKVLEGVMVGGNHLAVWLPDDHPTAETEPLAALEKIGAGVSFDVWCCWRSIMQARTTLAELKGDT